jgi:hypothetical protein
MIRYIGIDPGWSGAICVIDVFGYPKPNRIQQHKIPDTETDLFGIFDKLITEEEHQPNACYAVIEKVGGYIGGGEGKGGGAANGTAMFKFGWSYGLLRMGLIAAKIPFIEVVPQNWQKEFGLVRKKGTSKPDFKKMIRGKAQQLFPSENVLRDTADALKIAEYCRRKYPK